MSQATLRTISLLPFGEGVQRVEVDCEHAVTGVTWAVAPGEVDVREDDAVRLALARHYGEEGCACTAKLWRRYWRTEPGEIPLVRGEPPT